MIERISIFCVRAVAAFFRVLGSPACRFHPSCSVYSCDAFMRFGWFKAAGLTLKRILRCQPFSAGGHDPL
jgi:uncharacterized protein